MAFGAIFWFIVPRYYYRLGKMAKRSLDSLRSSRSATAMARFRPSKVTTMLFCVPVSICGEDQIRIPRASCTLKVHLYRHHGRNSPQPARKQLLLLDRQADLLAGITASCPTARTGAVIADCLEHVAVRCRLAVQARSQRDVVLFWS